MYEQKYKIENRKHKTITSVQITTIYLTSTYNTYVTKHTSNHSEILIIEQNFELYFITIPERFF